MTFTRAIYFGLGFWLARHLFRRRTLSGEEMIARLRELGAL